MKNKTGAGIRYFGAENGDLISFLLLALAGKNSHLNDARSAKCQQMTRRSLNDARSAKCQQATNKDPYAVKCFYAWSSNELIMSVMVCMHQALVTSYCPICVRLSAAR